MSHQVLPSSTLENHQLTQNKVKASHFTHNFTDRERERERERMSREEKVVCVTGASGYIAAWLVKLLLQRGYTIKATVRDTSQCFLSLSLSPIYIILLLCTENIGPVLCIHFKIHSFRFHFLDLIMILFFLD